MSRPDRSDEHVPAWPAAMPPASRAPSAWEEAPESEAPAARSFSARVVWRAVRRHWWQIALLWVAGSSALMVMAYKKIKPVYEAKAQVVIRPEADGIFDRGGNVADFSRYHKTQVQLVTSTDVLSNTMAKHPELGNWPMLRGDDPDAAIRDKLRVAIVLDTNLIEVALSSEIRDEAVAIVDRVVEAYLLEANAWASRESRERLDRLVAEREKREAIIKEKQKQLQVKSNATKGFQQPDAAKHQAEGSLALYNRLQDELYKIEFEQFGARGELAGLEDQVRMLSSSTRAVSDQAVEARLLTTASIPELQAEHKRLTDRLEQVGKTAKRKNDPAVVHLREAIKKAEGEISRLFRLREPAVRRQLEQEARPADGGIEQMIAAKQSRLTALESLRKAVDAKKNKLAGDLKVVENGDLEVEFAKVDLDRHQRHMDAINDGINKLEFEAHGPAKIERFARTQVVPSANRRLRFMAAAPVAVLALVLGIFVLIEVRSGRVSDPDDVMARTRVEVLGVVPPLPSLNPPKAIWGGRGEYKARQRLEEFVQSLDHLRVALCSSPRGGDGHRCILITSAMGSEGKTTLAAHLAGRCANAGLSTLLIDADLRNPSLSRLLKVPAGVGLSDVLRGVATPEEALMVIEAGGGFHLLPAGTMGHDPSRLLQGDRLGQLLAQFRQAFDMVIVDAPPVLVVPDALVIGRCTDGAVLAVRYDTSRFRLLERANRRLAAVGVPVLGAVVNGVRTMESSYGSYGYSYAYQGGRAEDDAGMIDVPAEPI